MREGMPGIMKGEVSVFEMAHPDRLIFHRKNVICGNTSYLIARLLMNSSDLTAGVWGLALGAGGTDPVWSASTLPIAQPTQQGMVTEIKRKPLSQVQFLDGNGQPSVGGRITNVVSFLTILNENLDAIQVPIREMGLIGGGTRTGAGGQPTVMSGASQADYFDNTNPNADSVVLINYVTTPPWVLPARTDMGVKWDLTL